MFSYDGGTSQKVTVKRWHWRNAFSPTCKPGEVRNELTISELVTNPKSRLILPDRLQKKKKQIMQMSTPMHLALHCVSLLLTLMHLSRSFLLTQDFRTFSHWFTQQAAVGLQGNHSPRFPQNDTLYMPSPAPRSILHVKWKANIFTTLLCRFFFFAAFLCPHPCFLKKMFNAAS